MKKKYSWVGVTSWYLCIADDSRIPKMPIINPLQALFHPQTQKKKNYPAWIINPQPQLLKIRLFLVKICRLGIVDFNLPSNWRVSQLQESEFAVLNLGFEMLGLGLDNRGRIDNQTTKNAYRRIYSLWIFDSVVVMDTNMKKFSLTMRVSSRQWIDLDFTF